MPSSRAPLRTAGPDAIQEAAGILSRGGLVAFPTETVYGLGADARNGRAVARIFEAKGRPRFNPLIVHVADRATAEALAVFPPSAVRLATAFWPGPLTLVLERKPESGLSDLVSAGLDSVAIRVPHHTVAQALLRASGCPIAAPSANRSGHVSPTQADHVAGDLGDRVDLILDGGPCGIGLESTILDVREEPVRLLRAGGITAEEITQVLGHAPLRGGDDGERPASPGQLESHYAPRANLRLCASSAGPGEALLAFGPQPAPHAGPSINLSPSGDLVEAAANLFAALRTLDASGAAMIAVAPIPQEGLGEAINDRLQRAAAPRPGEDRRSE